MSEHLTYTKSGAVATIRFNRPEKKNALTVVMYSTMCDAIEDANSDPAIRAIAILGGDDFTAGNDLADFLAAGAVTGDDLPVVRFLRVLDACAKPIVAGVKGAAIGIGTTLLMHCDATVIGRSAKLAMPFTKLGLVPEAGSSLLFSLIVGRMRASWLILSGERFGADDAERIGLATCVAEDLEVDAKALAMCETLAALPPNAVTTTKRLLKAHFADSVKATIENEIVEFGKAVASDEARAAMMAFFTKK
jgi:enoyl-CoA hydratase/carnithine racemase